jgi:lipoprotein-anchoring transpeptidase ErfK/SrfK
MKVDFSVKQLGARRTPKRSGLPHLLMGLLFFVGIGFAVWYFVFRSDGFSEPEANPLPPTGGTASDGSGQTGGVPPVSLPPETVRKLESELAAAKEFLAASEFQSARDAARRIVASGLPEGHPLWESAASLLGQANIQIVTTDIPVPEKVVHNVKSGDTLDQIAKRCNSTIEAIRRSNGLDSQSSVIHPGMQLRIYRGDWRIVVGKKRFRLYLYDGDHLFKIYPVGIGRQNRTPAGTFVIVEKIHEPTWDYKGKRYLYGDKENVLGSRWMRLEPTGETNPDLSGYGIHGTWEPETIGTSASNGCVRLRNEDVEELFDVLPKYSKDDGRYVDVTILEE